MPKVSFSSLRRTIIILILAGGIFSIGYLFGNKGYQGSLKNFPQVTISREVPADKKNLDFSLFWKVWDTLEASYFDKSKINHQDMVYGAISGLVSALGDPYTVFLPPQENKLTEEDLSGNFEGVGIQIGFKGTQLAVIAPLPGSPAEREGIKAGDLIEGIKDDVKKIDRGTVGITLTDAVKDIRGPAGTRVTLLLSREGIADLFTKDIIREKVVVPSVTLSYEGEGESIAHIKLLKFGGETDNEWQKIVREIVDRKSAKSVILDLRNNPGGYLQSAVDITGEFTKVGTVAAIEERGNGERFEFKTERTGLLLNMPVVVLINQGSASASEILAGALRDIRKIKLVGDKSFGKGTIQEPQDLEGGAGLHITVAKWLTPNGVWVNEKGLDPDVKIADDDKTPEDEQLNEAIKLLK